MNDLIMILQEIYTQELMCEPTLSIPVKRSPASGNCNEARTPSHADDDGGQEPERRLRSTAGHRLK